MKYISSQKPFSKKYRKREKLRCKGQFWTPEWIAEAMVIYVSQEAKVIFDPCVGKGAFYTALKKVTRNKQFFGIDIDSKIIIEAKKEKIFDKSTKLQNLDFITHPPKQLFKAIVANPPYIRHHRLSQKQKKYSRRLCSAIIGDTLDGRAGLHIYFLIQALNLLDKGGRLAFIMPADTCEGIFSKKLWNWIARKFRIDGIVTFEHTATPFPGVDINPIIFLIKNEKPSKNIKWVKCLKSQNKELFLFLKNNLSKGNFTSLKIYNRNPTEALSTGLSRIPRVNNISHLTLSDFASVMRGIATGANDFFFLTQDQISKMKIPDEFLLPAIGRTRDINGAYITIETLINLQKNGRPTFLFFPNHYCWKDMPESVKEYIRKGEEQGIAKRTLVSTRRPWYKMEVRKVPTFLFAYLGRRNIRFIKNEAGVVPLTGFLCIYPHSNEKRYIDNLWKILQHPDTVSNLQFVGKSYGSGALKVEPRALENLPISSVLVNQFNLQPFQSELTIF